jgi:hypothetical protein
MSCRTPGEDLRHGPNEQIEAFVGLERAHVGHDLPAFQPPLPLEWPGRHRRVECVRVDTVFDNEQTVGIDTLRQLVSERSANRDNGVGPP